MDFAARGKFGRPWELGQKICGNGVLGEEEIQMNVNELGYLRLGAIELGSEDRRWGIYQLRNVNGKRFYIREEFMVPDNPRSDAQQAWRDLFKTAMTEWSALTDAEKWVYHKRGTKVGLQGRNIFVKQYLNSHK